MPDELTLQRQATERAEAEARRLRRLAEEEARRNPARKPPAIVATTPSKGTFSVVGKTPNRRDPSLRGKKGQQIQSFGKIPGSGPSKFSDQE